MTRLDSILTGTVWAQADIAKLKAALPSLAPFPNGLVEMLYERFSTAMYNASWMGTIDEEILDGFSRWLAEETDRG